jgi:hypothetical protein
LPITSDGNGEACCEAWKLRENKYKKKKNTKEKRFRTKYKELKYLAH